MPTVVDADFIGNAVKELPIVFDSWFKRTKQIKAIIQPRPEHNVLNRSLQNFSGIPLSSAEILQRIGTDAEHRVAHASDYISPRVQVIWENFVSRATNFPPKIEARYLEDTPAGQQTQRHLFQFFGGVHNFLNDEWQRLALGTSWDRGILAQIATFGKSIIFPHARNVRGQAVFSANLYDPLSCSHDFDSWPRRFVRQFQMGVPDVRRMLQMFEDKGLADISTDLKKRMDEFAEQQNAMTISDVFVEEPVGRFGDRYDVHHGIVVEGEVPIVFKTMFEHLPIVIISSHSAPGVAADFRRGQSTRDLPESTRGVTDDRVYYHAESFLAPLLYLSLQHRQFMSTLMEGIGRALNPPKEVTIENDAQDEVPTVEQTGQGAMWPHGPDITLKLQAQATAAMDVASRIFQENVDKEFDLLYNKVLLGQSDAGSSGFLQTTKISHARASVQESIRAGSASMKRTFDELAHQFIKADLMFHVDGWKQFGMGAPHYWPGGDFTKEDFPPQYILNVEVIADLPRDDFGKTELARSQVESKFFSRREVMENALDNEDVELTMALIDQQDYNDLESVAARRHLTTARLEVRALFDAAERETDPVTKRDLLDEADIAAIDLKAFRARVTGQVQSANQPTAPVRFSPENLPDGTAGPSVDEIAAGQGRQSSSTQGNPGQRVGA